MRLDVTFTGRGLQPGYTHKIKQQQKKQQVKRYPHMELFSNDPSQLAQE